ncbi:phytanoyl-CoA dioxygenase family protein [Streptomyces sp. NPDC046805]|uniref:phytanoyl-CoA dioxygenase family protein n=1 Tax=Streptomyces sp. NPDC046805 TaxID=3155134 RepID=UPI0033F7B554
MLTADDIATYHRDGVLVMPGLFSRAETEALQSAFERDAKIPGGHRITEANDTDVRAVYASHWRQPEFASLTRSARLLGSAQRLLDAPLYVYQLKTNAKPAFGGDKWAWHQDFLAWRLADNIARPRLVNAVVFLDDVTEFNGPVIFVPRSHTAGLVRRDRNDTARSAQHLDPDDIELTPAELAACVDQGGMVSPKGPAGSVVFFHPEIVHGSAPNMSPHPRRLAIVTYNDVANPPRPTGTPRPEYLAARNVTPLTVEDDVLAGGRA